MVKMQPWEIFALVRKRTGITREKLTGDQRTRPVVEARKLFSSIAHRAGYSYSSIGRHLHKDHSTIIHHLKKVRA